MSCHLAFDYFLKFFCYNVLVKITKVGIYDEWKSSFLLCVVIGEGLFPTLLVDAFSKV